MFQIGRSFCFNGHSHLVRARRFPALPVFISASDVSKSPYYESLVEIRHTSPIRRFGTVFRQHPHHRIGGALSGGGATAVCKEQEEIRLFFHLLLGMVVLD